MAASLVSAVRQGLALSARRSMFTSAVVRTGGLGVTGRIPTEDEQTVGPERSELEALKEGREVRDGATQCPTVIWCAQ